MSATADDLQSPSPSLWGRLAGRIASETGGEPPTAAAPGWPEPDWEQAAPGVSCKVLATDADREVVSMLVRLAPGAHYPPHRHAGVEELYLLGGELFIDGEELHAGNYRRAERGTAHARVSSETGCTCVLITSTQDLIDHPIR